MSGRICSRGRMSAGVGGVTGGLAPALTMAVFLFPLLAHGAIKEEPIPELKPPAGRLEVKEITKPSRLWLLAPAGGLAAGLVILLLRRKEAPLPVPPATRARRDLVALNGRGDAAAVARVFREYVEAALGVRGRSATVEEMVAALSCHPGWSDALGEGVRRFMDPVELAKFAPQVPAPPVERVVEEAMGLVTEIETMRGGKA